MKASIQEAPTTAKYADEYAEVHAEATVYSRETLTEARRVAKLAEASPDVREEIVASLRARIESGSYHISAESIAERIMQRALESRMR
ncbi:MAG: flagellar biosynthesis anti-sigma factor FlgM [Armatimonadetes bacterium]|nr:flagellar biosynthesis anti-sigma factor FlgM [Armatimonadota bacterium]